MALDLDGIVLNRPETNLKNIEVEIKLFATSADDLFAWLNTSAEYLGMTRQEDRYFQPKNRPFVMKKGEFWDADEWFRMRVSRAEGQKEKEVSVCYKRWFRDDKGQSSYADEFETKVEKADEMLAIIGALGFQEVSYVSKKRRSFAFDRVRFDCDEVEGLGWFVEIEVVTGFSSPEEGMAILNEVLTEAGLQDWPLIDRGYSWIQWNGLVHGQ